MTEVVSAVIVRDSRVLLTQRRADKDFPFTWETPGGKVDEGETHFDALAREMLEELGLRVLPLTSTPLYQREYHNEVKREDRRHIHLSFYSCTLAGDESPKPCEGQGIGWFTEAEMALLTLTPGNEDAFPSISVFMRGVR